MSQFSLKPTCLTSGNSGKQQSGEVGQDVASSQSHGEEEESDGSSMDQIVTAERQHYLTIDEVGGSVIPGTSDSEVMAREMYWDCTQDNTGNKQLQGQVLLAQKHRQGRTNVKENLGRAMGSKRFERSAEGSNPIPPDPRNYRETDSRRREVWENPYDTESRKRYSILFQAFCRQ
jgi:hypothetical protein